MKTKGGTSLPYGWNIMREQGMWNFPTTIHLDQQIQGHKLYLEISFYFLHYKNPYPIYITYLIYIIMLKLYNEIRQQTHITHPFNVIDVMYYF